MIPRSIDYKVKDGMVQTTHGPSLHVDPSHVARFGNPTRVAEYPDGLRIIQRGNDPGHHGIFPVEDMPLDCFLDLLGQVRL